jgi:hypothetical protein
MNPLQKSKYWTFPRIGIFLLLALSLAGCQRTGPAKTGTSTQTEGLLPAPKKWN